MHNDAAQTRIALVTGANRGLGLAIAKGLSAIKNVHVLAAARRAKDAQAAADGIGNETVGVELNLSDPLSIESQALKIVADHGSIDILVNNAGILIPGTGMDIGPAEVVESLMVNTVAPFALIRALGPGMRARGWGRIVNVSSGWGSFDEGLSGPTAYAVSKAALNAMTLSLAATLGLAVKINAACPGWVRTRMGGQIATNSPAEGADTPIWLATLPDDGPTGGFFRDRRLIEW